VSGNNQALAEGYFTTRQPRGHTWIRFAAFGDNSYGDISDRAIAYHTYKQNPDFAMNCGDNVYESGTRRRVSAGTFRSATPIWPDLVRVRRSSGPCRSTR
jgi:hypothetical protein